MSPFSGPHRNPKEQHMAKTPPEPDPTEPTPTKPQPTKPYEEPHRH